MKIKLHQLLLTFLLIGLLTNCSHYIEEINENEIVIDNTESTKDAANSDELVAFVSAVEQYATEFKDKLLSLNEDEQNYFMNNANNEEFAMHFLKEQNLLQGMILLQNITDTLVQKTNYQKNNKAEQVKMFQDIYTVNYQGSKIKLANIDVCEAQYQTDLFFANVVLLAEEVACALAAPTVIGCIACVSAALASYFNEMRKIERAYQACLKANAT
jgi:hypothetical protein